MASRILAADLYLTSSVEVAGLTPDSSGTGEVASMRAGFRMMGRDMGGTPTCRGEARGCRMRGDWLRGDGAGMGGVVNGGGVAGMAGGVGGDWSEPAGENRVSGAFCPGGIWTSGGPTVLPLVLGGLGFCGDSRLLGVSAWPAGTGEGCWV